MITDVLHLWKVQVVLVDVDVGQLHHGVLKVCLVRPEKMTMEAKDDCSEGSILFSALHKLPQLSDCSRARNLGNFCFVFYTLNAIFVHPIENDGLGNGEDVAWFQPLQEAAQWTRPEAHLHLRLDFMVISHPPVYAALPEPIVSCSLFI